MHLTDRSIWPPAVLLAVVCALPVLASVASIGPAVSPNAASVRYALPCTNDARLLIHDSAGREVIFRMLARDGGRLRLDLGPLRSSAYLAWLSAGRGLTGEKLVVW